MKLHRMRVCVDFDGVLHNYSEGYKDGSLYGDPIKGAMDSIVELFDTGHQIYILTARDKDQHKKVETWIRKHLPETHKDIPFEVSNVKPAAAAYLDDKAIHFFNWESAMKDIISQIEEEMKRPD